MSTHWGDISDKVIEEAAGKLPPTATYTEVRKAIDEAYPFPKRSYWPYKCWMGHRLRYLRKRFPPAPKGEPMPLFAPELLTHAGRIRRR